MEETVIESEKEIQKQRQKKRFLVVLVVIDILLGLYLAYEMISVFAN